MSKYMIMAVLIENRKAKASEVQDLFTKFGCNIKMRLGLHETTNVCAEDGLVILQLSGDDEEIKRLETELNQLDGVKSNLITLSSDEK